MGYDHPGQPTMYNEEIADKICSLIATSSKGLPQICREDDSLPAVSTIRLWISKHPEFLDKYLSAKQLQAHWYTEETLEIAKEQHCYFDSDGQERMDPGFVAWQKLNINTRQWHASKLAPKVYGDKTQTEVTSSDDVKDEEIRKLRAELDAKNKKAY